MNGAPELQSVATFIQYVKDDERDYLTREELDELSFATKTSTAKIVAELRRNGLVVVTDKIQQVRGFKSNPYTRWDSCPSHGGSGATQISGFAGKEG